MLLCMWRFVRCELFIPYISHMTMYLIIIYKLERLDDRRMTCETNVETTYMRFVRPINAYVLLWHSATCNYDCPIPNRTMVVFVCMHD
jgi:hypothetical protein